VEEIMRAIMFRAFGGNDVIDIQDVPKPTPRPDEVLIRVHAAGVNPVDWKVREGQAKILTGSRPLGLAYSRLYTGVLFV